MDNPTIYLRIALLAVVLAPLAGALALALAGTRGVNPRRLALWLALAHLVLTGGVVLFAAPVLSARGETPMARAVQRGEAGFSPLFVPGDPAVLGSPESDTNATNWDVFTLDPPTIQAPTSIQFFIGLDGLNVWLVLLTSLMTVVAVLVSWDAIGDRAAGFYAWLFVLQSALLGAFTAFDVVLFYVFFELTLIPSFFLIGSWGSGPAPRDAARRFFLYTLFGSLITLTGLIGVILTNPVPLNPYGDSKMPYFNQPADPPNGHYLAPRPGPRTFSLPVLMKSVSAWAKFKDFGARYTAAKAAFQADVAKAADAKAAAAPADAQLRRAADAARSELKRSEDEKAAAAADNASYRAVQVWLFFALMAGFAVKVPIVPFHTWLPAAYNEAPIGVTVLLAALLGKLGTYGILRIVLPLSPDPAAAYGLAVFGTLGAAGIVYGAFCAYAQKDIKLLTAYSSVSHLGFLVAALFTLNTEGMTGASLHMVNHGLATGAMFALLAFLLDRYRTLDMNQYGGLMAKYPAFTFLLFVIALAGIGLPGLNNFVSEMLMLAGLFDPSYTRAAGYGLAAAAAIGVFLSAWYVLTMIRRVVFGPLREPAAVVSTPKDLSVREWIAFGLPAAACLYLGVYPQPVIDTMKADVAVVATIGLQARERAAGASIEDRPIKNPAPPFRGGVPQPFGAAAGGPGGGGNPKGGNPKGGNPKGGNPKGGNPKGADEKGPPAAAPAPTPKK
ncbi:complex I subunit 4 family protein [Fimbriiglobus ruber]|uniref:NADH-ubiquinone oxidoreductase chain M n=1 Tax=Fimbriiglobus ruber TaxID=1908690 RepID=A0A225DZ81_9BACT|nr:NADH-quinone oxidoreductase subunit M [Fimbriiglobus ruber]OWK41655.1 NADH-ubiquinone oxidoreductase chain M [Fimbriiglobus ruber]